MTDELFDRLGRRRSPATHTSFRLGVKPGNAGKTYSPLILSPRDVERALAGCENNPAGRRDRGIIGLLYRTGLTALEVIDLKLNDIDLSPGNESVAVAAGRLSARRVALDDAALMLLREWLEVRARYPDGHLFCIVQGPSKGGRWSESALRTRMRTLGESLGWSRLVPSDFRYSFIADLLIEQWPIPYIQAQLGITTLRAFDKLFEHLGIAVPEQAEVAEIIRTRHWPLDGDAP